MSSGSFPVLLQNCKNIVPGLAAYAASIPANMGTLKKFADRRVSEEAPASVREQAETFETFYYKRHLCQNNLWIDPKIAQVATRKEIADLQTYKINTWRAGHCLALPFMTLGGYAAPWFVAYAGNYNNMVSTVPQTADEKKAYLEAQDLVRYKFAPAYLAQMKWVMESHIEIPEKFHAGWEELYSKEARRDPATIRQTDEFFDHYQKFSLLSRKQIRALARAMNFPTYPTFGKICLQKRVGDYWELNWNEDYLVLTSENSGVASMSDEELHDYAWRRFLAPYDKNLSREDILQRVGDYHAFLGKEFVSEAKQPNLFQTVSYVLGYYNDPAYLEEDFASLESNDFEHLAYWGKDNFIKRLEFENGPLRDQVEAHVQKKLTEREAALKKVDEEIARIQTGNAKTE